MMLWLNASTCLFSLSQTSSDIRFGDRNPDLLTHRHRRLLTQKRTFSPAYYCTVGTSGDAVKSYVISAGLWLEYLQSSVFISIYQTQMKLEPSSRVCQTGNSTSEYVVGKS